MRTHAFRYVLATCSVVAVADFNLRRSTCTECDEVKSVRISQSLSLLDSNPPSRHLLACMHIYARIG
jgi:hypothetical protein